MSQHSVVALVWKDCGHCDKFKGDFEKEPHLANEISLCEKDADSCQYLCNIGEKCPYPNDRTPDGGFPTFKCIKNGLVMSGYDNIENVKKFVKDCNKPSGD